MQDEKPERTQNENEMIEALRSRYAKNWDENLSSENAAKSAWIDRACINSFSVRQGRGSGRGTVEIEVMWEAGRGDLLQVFRSKWGNMAHIENQSDLVEAGIRIGTERGGDPFVFVDANVDHRKNYYYYAWIEGDYEFKYQYILGAPDLFSAENHARDLDELNSLLSELDGEDLRKQFRRETVVRPTRKTIHPMVESRSIAVLSAETQEEFLARKQRVLKKQHELDKISSATDEYAKPSIEEIIASVLKASGEEREIFEKIEGALAELEVDEETRELIETEVVRQYYSEK